jgi:hypothetical protein
VHRAGLAEATSMGFELGDRMREAVYINLGKIQSPFLFIFISDIVIVAVITKQLNRKYLAIIYGIEH